MSTPVPGWPQAITAVRARHPQVRLDLAASSTGAAVVSLALIQTLGERGTGLADAALSDLCATADAWRVTLTVTPEPLSGPAGRGVRAGRLKGWYASHGFTRRPRAEFQINDTMWRRPA